MPLDVDQAQWLVLQRDLIYALIGVAALAAIGVAGFVGWSLWQICRGED